MNDIPKGWSVVGQPDQQNQQQFADIPSGFSILKDGQSSPTEDNRIAYRGAILPVARQKDGDLVPALPSFIHEPLQTIKGMMSGEIETPTGKQVLDLGGLFGGASVASRALGVARQAPISSGIRSTANAVTMPIRRAGGKVKDLSESALAKPEDASERLLKTAIQRSGKTPDEIIQNYNIGQEATHFGPNSQARLPESLAELGGEATQSLLEQTIVAPGRARGIVKDKLYSRQAGTRSPYSTEPLPKKVPDQQAQFGQMERLMDSVARSLQVKDSPTALKTEGQIMRDLKAKAGPIYKKSWDNADAFDLVPAIKKASEAMEHLPDSGKISKSLKKAMGHLMIKDGEDVRLIGAGSELRRFDGAKREIDQAINIAVRQGKGEIVRTLTQFKSELLDAVHGGSRLNPTKNKGYADARDIFSDGKQLQSAIQLGRDAFKDGAELSVEKFSALSAGEKRMARLGLYDAIRGKMKSRKATDDTTQLFRQRDVAEILKAAMPKGKKIKKSDNFGELLSREQKMVGTRSMMANSRTAFRLEGQADFDRIGMFMDRFKNQGLTTAVADSLSSELRKMFGMREQTATILAKQLTSTDPAVIRSIVTRLKKANPKIAQKVPGLMKKAVVQIENAGHRSNVQNVPNAEPEDKEFTRQWLAGTAS